MHETSTGSVRDDDPDSYRESGTTGDAMNTSTSLSTDAGIQKKYTKTKE
ncbi:MAG: hypothetical protein WDN26_11665 [Chitinophagaceae bacterium]